MAAMPDELPDDKAISTSDEGAGLNQCQPYHVFVSHAGEQKLVVVDHIHHRFTNEHPNLRVFVDEWSLKVGDRAMEHIWGACHQALIGEASCRRDNIVRRGEAATTSLCLINSWLAVCAQHLHLHKLPVKTLP
jgi:hypothetical protein